MSMGPRLVPLTPVIGSRMAHDLHQATGCPAQGLGWEQRERCCFYRLADLVVEHHIEEPGCWSLDLNWNPIFIIGQVTFLKLNIAKNWLPWGFLWLGW